MCSVFEEFRGLSPFRLPIDRAVGPHGRRIRGGPVLVSLSPLLSLGGAPFEAGSVCPVAYLGGKRGQPGVTFERDRGPREKGTPGERSSSSSDGPDEEGVFAQFYPNKVLLFCFALVL